MKSEYVKKLTGKNPKEFEFAASHIINDADVDAFSALVEQSDFLFDFIKKNVGKRLLSACNENNYKNLLEFLKVHSPDYEEFIISTLVKYADEDMTDEMLERLERGTDAEKAYAAKYFSHIHDSLAIEPLRNCAYSEFDPLAINCSLALSEMKDDVSYEFALRRLKSDDEFEKLSAVKFLAAYGEQKALGEIFEAMKTSSMAENIASEIPYIKSFIELLDGEFKSDALLALNHVIHGLGEIISLSQLFDFQLFEVLEKLIQESNDQKNSKFAVVLLNAKDKFEQLTENDEYIFDEDKNTKAEVYEIKNLLNAQNEDFWGVQKDLIEGELTETSEFVFTALELVKDFGISKTLDALKAMLNSKNQTLILKTIEVLKSLNKLDEINQVDVLKNITDENIKAIIGSLFGE